MHFHFTCKKAFALLVFASAVLLTSQTALAQNTGIIQGKIVSETDEQPLPGVTVTATNGTTGKIITTQSAETGLFRMSNLPVGATYTFQFTYTSYSPYTLKNIKIVAGTGNSLLVRMAQSTSALNQVVVIGYGTQERRDVSTSVARVGSSELRDQPVNNVAEALVGKMAGVQVTQQSGEPGAALVFKIRGVGSITAGTEPLVVIDGVPTTGTRLNSFNTNDIESVEVLKDASSAAIYGSRGSNGVVLITTKKGKNGKAVINYNSYYGVQQVAKKIDQLDAYQYASLVVDSHNNTYTDLMESINRQRAAAGQAPIVYSTADNNGVRLANTGSNTNTVIPAEVLPYLQKQPGLTNTNWQNEIFRSAPMQSHNISAAGGNGAVQYFTSLEYFNQDGVVINSNFKRYSGRLNLTVKQQKLRLGVNLNPSYIQEKRINADGPYNVDGGGIVASALHYAPIWPVYNADGSFNFSQNSWSSATVTTLPNGSTVSGNAQTQAWNPVALATLVQNPITRLRLLGNVFAEYDLLPGLKLRTSAGIDLLSGRDNSFRPSTLPLSNTANNTESVATGTSSSFLTTNWLWENTLNYQQKIGNHKFSVLVGSTIQKETNESNTLTASSGFISNRITTLNAGNVTNGASNVSQWSLASFLGRMQYSFSGKYLLTATLRADGASRFGSNNLWGYFPSVSGGWVVSEESFIKDKLPVIAELKLRASYGLTGNFRIPNYGAKGQLSYNSYILGSTTPAAVTGVAPSAPPNPNLSWEKTHQANVGMDLVLWKDLLTLTVDAYNSNTTDLLLNVPVPLSNGYTSVLQNIGKLGNKGIEIDLGLHKKLGALTVDFGTNFSMNRNKVKELGPDNADIISTGSVGNAYFLTRVGQPIGSYFLPVVLGVFQNQAEVNAYPHFIDAASNFDLATSKPGDFKFQDTDGDGVIDFNKDRAIVGNYLPKFTYAFTGSATYKNFDVAIATQGIYGNKILNLSRRYFFNIEGNMNNYVGALNRWQSEANPGDGRTVRANRVSKGQNGITSTWHVEDGSYFRIRTITVGYSVPTKLFGNRRLFTKARLYVSLQNPFTFTHYSGYNPEVSNRSAATTNGEDYGVYPINKITTVGVQLSF